MQRGRSFSLRVAAADDAPALSDLAKRTFVETFAHIHTAQNLQLHVAAAYAVEQVRREIEDSTRYTVLLFPADDAATPCGYAMLSDGSVRPHDGDDDGEPLSADECLEVKRVYVDSAFHGSGAAHALMEHVRAVARSKMQSRRVVWLATWRGNARAIAFYNKHGFVVTGARTARFGDGDVDDVVLTLQQQPDVDDDVAKR